MRDDTSNASLRGGDDRISQSDGTSLSVSTSANYDGVVTRLETVNGATARRRARVRPTSPARQEPPEIIGSSRAIRQVRELISAYGPHPDSVLITGETGVGKEAVAAGLHAASERADGPLVVHNAARVDSELTGSQFFGHVRGAFTGAERDRIGLFEQADGGTLHLDEIGDMPVDLQANFLRVLEDGLVTPVGGNDARRVDVRIISATNKDLASEADAGRFRRDLHYRINVLNINVPPLRERGDDIVELAEHFIAKRCERTGASVKLTPAAADLLKQHAWPGNVRELKNCMTRAMILALGKDVTPDAIVFDEPATCGSYDIEAAKQAMVRYLTAAALGRTNGNVSKAAQLTGVSRTTLHGFRNDLGDSQSDLAKLRAALDIYLGG
ncbi:MAG: two-component system response regulator [Alphaproteobacteria bacterium]|nr:two-component system response regulator [Alphaproteobacteria bacterium]